MGKYKQWLHHQEVGRRLREQIATHEQERERVQRMAPSHPTTLPDTANPLVRALLDYTGRGGTLGRASSAKIGGEPQQRPPATSAFAAQLSVPAAPATPTGSSAPPQASAAPAPADDPVVARLAATAAQTPADPLEAMRRLAQSQTPPSQPPGAPATPSDPHPAAPPSNPAGEWWNRSHTPS